MLPASNEVELSFYNGMSDLCATPVFNMTYPDPGSGKEMFFTIDFNNFNKYPDDPSRERNYVVSQRLPNTVFTIQSTTVTCNKKVFNFGEYKFGKFPVSLPILVIYPSPTLLNVKISDIAPVWRFSTRVSLPNR